ncbi:MAG: hypothetical protein ACREMF_00380, partial [Gemmatimonadales bacterium]
MRAALLAAAVALLVVAPVPALHAQECPLNLQNENEGSGPNQPGSVGVLAGGADYAVSVTPDGAAAQWPWNSTGRTFVFTVSNVGSCDDTYSINVTKTGTITAASANPISVFLLAGTQTSVTVTYSVGTAPSGLITLTATGSFAVNDNGTLNVTTFNPVAVTPDGGTAPSRTPNTTGHVEVFTITNAGATQLTLTLTCAGMVNVTCIGTNPPSVVLAGNGGVTTATASFNVGAAGSGILKLTVTGGGASDSGTYNVPVVVRAVAVRAELSERQHFSGTSGSQRFFVKNLQAVTATYNLSTGCSGGVTGCSVAPTSVSLTPGESKVATLNYTVGTAGSTGIGMVKAVSAAASTLRDSSGVAVKAVGPPFPVVSVVEVNPGTSVERSLCLAVAAGPAAAYECGDLRIVHALPAIRTLGRTRVPTLLYNSTHADPYSIVAASVTLASGAGLPDSVEAIVFVGGQQKAQGRWAGSNWSPGTTRRIALGSAVLSDTTPLGDTTRVIDYTLEVATIYLAAPGSRNATTVSGKVIVVKRRRSSFGAGWWLAGLERLSALSDSSRLWVGGDGSARVYSPAGPNIWVAPNLDRPDTLTRIGTTYRRRVPGGDTVTFNSAGQHDTTINRLGHRTTFTYTSGRLTSITLPSQGGGQVYNLGYNGNSQLSSVTAPGGRVTTVWVNSQRTDSIRDPDTHVVRFTYESSSSRRIATRKDRRATVTSYSYDAARKLSRAHISLQPDSIRVGFRAVDSVGLATAVPKTATDTANAFTSIFGARHFATGANFIAQETRFWVDRYGAPRRIVNVLGHQTLLKREDGQWSAAVTELVAADGFTTRAGYDARGNILRSTAVNPLNTGQDAITRYHWDARWDFVDSVITPTGIVTTFLYDANGNRLWEQVGSDPLRRVTFRYGNTLKLLSSTVVPLTPPDSILYNARGNVAAIRTPLGYWTSSYRDALGRDTLVVTPIGSTDLSRGGAQDSTLRMRQRTVYTNMDRDSIAETIAPNRVQTVRVDTRYDSEGNATSLARVSAPNVTGIGTLTTQWRYDRANRRVAEVAPDGAVDSTVYDPAGNAVVALTRRTDPTSGARLFLTMAYDALNRLLTRILPPVNYTSRPSNLNTTPPNQAPMYPAYQVPGETQTFTYDAMGRLLTADNLDARVKRSYHPGGLLRTDSSRIQTVGRTDWNQHKYGLLHTYNLDGRRLSLALPQQLLAPGLLSTMTFVYHPQLGLLQTVNDLHGNPYHFHHSLRNDLDSLRYPGSYHQRFTYDADGRLLADTVRNLGGLSFPRFTANPIRATSYLYDAQDRLLSSRDPLGYQDTLTVTYTGLGHLATSKLTEHGFGGVGLYPARFVSAESFSFDALGNRYYGQTLVFCYVNSVKLVMLPFLEGAWRTGHDPSYSTRANVRSWSAW